MTPQFRSFFEELEKISSLKVNKGFAQGVKRNVVGAFRDLKSPVKAIKKEVKTIKRDVTGKSSKSAWTRGAYLAGHGANVAMTAAQVPSAIREKDDTGMQRSRLQRLSTLAGSTLGGMATGSRGLSGGLIGGVAGGAAGHLAGKAVDKIRGYKPKAD